MNPNAACEPRPSRWAGICAGGYFTAAAIYLANAAVMTGPQNRNWVAAVLLLAIAGACVAIGVLVLAEHRRILKVAVVAAGGFAAIHLIGLTFLFFDTPPSTPLLAQSLQWQLGTAFLFVWLFVLAAALRLVRGHGL